jgi:hypothetical protein
MALTKQDWYDKLKSWLPSWMFESPEYQEAVYTALAKILSSGQFEAEDFFNQSFITRAAGSYLDLHGQERSVERLPGELDTTYSTRIRNYTNQSNIVSIQALVDALLINGQATISEDYNAQLFFDRDVYASRAQLFIETIINAFTIVVENQRHSPYSFMGREYFMDREDYVGTSESPEELFAAIVAAVNKAKAFGTMYRLYERSGE